MIKHASKLNKAPEAFTFDDFVLAPVHSDVRSRKDPDVSISLPNLRLEVPIISSPMNTITEAEMLRTMAHVGGTGVLHRYMSIDRQVEIAKELMEFGNIDDDGGIDNFFVAIGANGDTDEQVAKLLDAGVRNFCVDVANGHSVHCIEAVKAIKANAGTTVMAGNVCTFVGALKLADVGADLVRIGVGPGAVCTTRLVTGHGVPQLTAIETCSRVKGAHPELVIVADGGIRSSGDVVKALAIGADAVMLGSMLSGTSRREATRVIPTHPVQLEPTPSDQAVSTIDWIARLASDTPYCDDLSIATTMANADCALYGPEGTIEPS